MICATIGRGFELRSAWVPRQIWVLDRTMDLCLGFAMKLFYIQSSEGGYETCSMKRMFKMWVSDMILTKAVKSKRPRPRKYMDIFIDYTLFNGMFYFVRDPSLRVYV
jgi:hypothetical protein